jgi:hypothetical protein
VFWLSSWIALVSHRASRCREQGASALAFKGPAGWHAACIDLRHPTLARDPGSFFSLMSWDPGPDLSQAPIPKGSGPSSSRRWLLRTLGLRGAEAWRGGPVGVVMLSVVSQPIVLALHLGLPLPTPFASLIVRHHQAG